MTSRRILSAAIAVTVSYTHLDVYKRQGLTSVTTGATTINNEGLTIGGKKFVTANGFDANNTQIKNVKAGTDGNDAVNLNQLNEVKNASNLSLIHISIGDDAQATGSRSIALGVSAQAGTLERVRDRSVYKDNPELITKPVSYTHLK